MSHREYDPKGAVAPLLLYSDLSMQEQERVVPPGFAVAREIPEPGARSARSDDGFDRGVVGALLVYADAEACGQRLRWLRRHPQVALLPVFVILTTPFDPSSLDWADAADVVSHASEARWSEMGAAAGRIAASLKALAGSVGACLSAEERLIAFLASRRGLTLRPRPASDSPSGFTYPLAHALLDVGSGERVAHVLQHLADGRLLAKQHYGQVTSCPDCGDSRVEAPKECAKCGGRLTPAGPLIHHFSRGAMFPAAEKGAHGSDRCHDCGKSLGHAGIDFDCRTDLERCSICGSIVRERSEGAHCASCDATFERAAGVPVPMHAYGLAGDYPAGDGAFLARNEGSLLIDKVTFRSLLDAEARSVDWRGARSAAVRVTPESPLPRIPEDLLLLHLLDSIRESDVVARAGGGSFDVLMRGVRAKDAPKVAASLQDRLALRRPAVGATRVRVEAVDEEGLPIRSAAATRRDAAEMAARARLLAGPDRPDGNDGRLGLLGALMAPGAPTPSQPS